MERRGGQFSTIAPNEISSGDYLFGSSGRNYDISVDGTKFLMVKRADDDRREGKIVVVQNWLEELKRLVPVD